MRDSQKGRVYRAEDHAFAKPGEWNDTLATLEDVGEFIKSIMLRKRVQRLICPADPAKRRWESATSKPFSWFYRWDREGRPQILLRPGRSGAMAHTRNWLLEFAPSMMKKWIVVHELSHLMAPPTVHHGWQFCWTYLKLTRFVFGMKQEAELKWEFKNYRVKIGRPRKMSAARREQLRRQGEFLQSLKQT